MVQTQDGFEIANADLKLGSWRYYGDPTKWALNLKLGDLSKDSKILQFAENCQRNLTDDPDLSSDSNRLVKKNI